MVGNNPISRFDPFGEASQAQDVSDLRQVAIEWRQQGWDFPANLLTTFYTGKGSYSPSPSDIDKIKKSSEYRKAAQKYFDELAKKLCAQGKGGKVPISEGRDHGPYAFNIDYIYGINSELFYALGGAHFYYAGSLTLCCAPHCAWTAEVTMSQNDFYTFRPEDFSVIPKGRMLSPSYRKGHELEMTYGVKAFWHTETWSDKFTNQ